MERHSRHLSRSCNSMSKLEEGRLAEERFLSMGSSARAMATEGVGPQCSTARHLESGCWSCRTRERSRIGSRTKRSKTSSLCSHILALYPTVTHNQDQTSVVAPFHDLTPPLPPTV